MNSRKTLQELTLKDNFMFGAVMLDEDNCRRFLEMLLELQIERIEVSKEKSIVYHPEYKGVRLDVYAKDESNTRYNIDIVIPSKTDVLKTINCYWMMDAARYSSVQKEKTIKKYL